MDEIDEDQFLLELEAACQPKQSVYKPQSPIIQRNLNVRIPLKIPRPVSIHENANLSSSKSSPQQAHQAWQPTSFAEKDLLSISDSEESSSDDLVTFTPHIAEKSAKNGSQPVLFNVSNSSLLQSPNDSCRPSKESLKYRSKLIHKKNKALFVDLELKPSSSSYIPKKQSRVQKSILQFFPGRKEKANKNINSSTKKPYSAQYDTVSMKSELGVAMYKIVANYDSNFDYGLTSEFRVSQLHNSPDFSNLFHCALSEIPWDSILASGDFLSALVNPPWNEGITILDLKKYLHPITTKLMKQIGFLFIWCENEFIGSVVRMCAKWKFVYVENLCWVKLGVDHQIIRRRPQHGGICSQSKLTLLIFRKSLVKAQAAKKSKSEKNKEPEILIRHQRNVDVYFDIEKHWMGDLSRPYDYTYQMIETLLPSANYDPKTGRGKFVEFWARNQAPRKGWTSIVIDKVSNDYTQATVEPTMEMDEHEAEDQDVELILSQQCEAEGLEQSSVIDFFSFDEE